MKVHIKISPSPQLPHHREYGEAFAAGLKMHGIKEKDIVIEADFVTRRCDVAVFWGFHPRTADIRARQQAEGNRYLVMERAVLGPQMEMVQLGWDGQGALANFCNGASPPDRAEKYASLLKPQRRAKKQDYVLVIGQMPGDNSLSGMDIDQWRRDVVAQLSEITDRRIVYRPHPNDPRIALGEVGVSYLGGDLEPALAGAAVVVTYNSGTGVDAVLAGVPVITLDERSHAWPVAGHDLQAVADLAALKFDRKQWLNDLAYTQWSKAEIISGAAWEHLRQILREPFGNPSTGSGLRLRTSPQDDHSEGQG
ncbi:MAG: hypothetical protein IIA59_00645 [Candidatus Marinimicrobia bacterium]|nr:hypothetical protein [Candidatus Neomarinimicrobiota bacterium]